MTGHRFHELDVFASGSLSGNPLAVVHGADALDETTMQRFAAWTNLSETTFLMEPTDDRADYRVRIFTPASELPFAGHPTIGSAAAWIAAGGRSATPDRLVQQCGVGLVELRHDNARWAFAAPPLIRSGPLEEEGIASVVAMFGLDRSDVVDAQWVDNGPGWCALRLSSAEAVLAVEMPTGEVGPVFVGLVGPHSPGAECAIEVRAFFNDASGAVREDPVTGSLNASVAQWLLDIGVLEAPYVASQGIRLGRAGRIYLDRDSDGVVWVGGDAPVTVAGTVTL